jgi:hypothetical protein
LGSVVLRDRGGIGDVVRIFAVLDALAERGPVTFCTDAVYARLCLLCPSVADGRVEVLLRETVGRSPALPARTWGAIEDHPAGEEGRFPADHPVIDLFCPALRHEIATAGVPRMDRLECWAREARVWPLPPGSVRIRIPDEVQEQAEAWASSLPRPLIAVSPESNASIRTWRNGLAGGRRVGMVGDLLVRMIRRRWMPVVFAGDHTGLPAQHSIARDICLQAARLARCDLFIGPDSGMIHIAAALGVPTVGIFGPTLASKVMLPYVNRQINLTGVWGPSVRRTYGCERPCYGLPSGGFSRRCGGGRCHVMEQVREESVVDAAATILERRRSLRVLQTGV